MCGQKKFYLREFCAVVMGDLVERCGEEVVRGCIVPGLEGVEGGWESCTPELLYLLLLLEKHYGKVISVVTLHNMVSRYYISITIVAVPRVCCSLYCYVMSVQHK